MRCPFQQRWSLRASSRRKCGRHSSPPKCIASRNRRRRFGGLSLKGHGPARGVQANDCEKSSTTSTKPKKGTTNEDKNSRKHHCVSHIVHDAHGGSNANAGEHTWEEQASRGFFSAKNANRNRQRRHVWRSPHGKGQERG